MNGKSTKIHELTSRIPGSCKLALVSVAATALTTTALAVPATALAEEATEAPKPADAKEAASDAKQPAATDSYKVSETVAKDEQTFDTKDQAQKYLDNAKDKYAQVDKKDASATYEVKTAGPTQVKKDTTHTESSLVADGSKTFDNEADAKKFVEEGTSGYKDSEDTTYKTEGSVVEVPTDKTTTEVHVNVKSGTKDGFATKEDAQKWVQDETKDLKNTDDTRYNVKSDYTNNPTEEPDGDPVPGESVKTRSQDYDTYEEANDALKKDLFSDLNTPLHQVNYSEVQEETTVVKPESTETSTYQSEAYLTANNRDAAMNYEKGVYEKDGWTVVPSTTDKDPGVGIDGTFNKLKDPLPKYTVPANSFIVVKQAGWYALWTPDKISDELTNKIKEFVNENDPSTFGREFHGGNYGFNIDFWNIGSQGAGWYKVHNGNDGFYYAFVSSCDKISHLDYGGLSYTPGEYSFKLDLSRSVPAVTKTSYFYYKTVQDYTQPMKTVDHWTASYTVDMEKDVPVYEYEASYRVTQVKTVPDTGWKAGYEVIKTTELAPKPDQKPTPTPEPPKPETKNTDTAKVTPAVQKTNKPAGKAAKATKSTAQAKSSLPKTGDESTAGAAGVAAVAAALAAVGLGLRRERKQE